MPAKSDTRSLALPSRISKPLGARRAARRGKKLPAAPFRRTAGFRSAPPRPVEARRGRDEEGTESNRIDFRTR